MDNRLARAVSRPHPISHLRLPVLYSLQVLYFLFPVFCLPACTSRPAPPSILIGIVAPLSGSDAAVGAAFVRGCERAAAERNAAGGVRLRASGAGVAVALDVRDDRSETPLAESLLDALAEAGAVVSIATPNDVRAIAQAIVAERIERPLVVHPATAPGVPGSHMRWVFALPRDATPPAPAASSAGASETEIEARAHATLSAGLAALEGAGALDPVTVRAALQSAPPGSAPRD